VTSDPPAAVDDPLRPGHELVATGDRGRWRPDGRLELCGPAAGSLWWQGERLDLSAMAGALAAELALAFTSEGRRTLLVEADMARPALAARLGVECRPDYAVDAKLLGGVSVGVGPWVLQANLRDELRVLAEDAEGSADPVLIAGDFNSHGAVAELERAGFAWLTRRLGDTTRFRLLGIPITSLSYDHFLARGLRLAAIAPALGIVTDNHDASDHLPIWALLDPDADVTPNH